MSKLLKQPMSLKDIAATLSDGQNVRELCPFCMGGTTRELSLSVTRLGMNARYICFRASCGVRGNISYGGAVTPAKYTKPSGAVSRFHGECVRLSKGSLHFFRNKYNIQQPLLQEYGVKQAKKDGRILFPILSPNGGIRGDNVRAYKDLNSFHTGPKSIIYTEPGTNTMSWHRLPTDSGNVRSFQSMPDFFQGMLIVVEDQTSAIKASRMVDAVSLLGTNLTPNKFKEINTEVSDMGMYEKVVVLLDADAYRQAINMVTRFRTLLPSMCIHRLERDVKDMTYTELHSILSNILKGE